MLCKRQQGTRQFHSFKLVPNVSNTSDTGLLHVQSETGTLYQIESLNSSQWKLSKWPSKHQTFLRGEGRGEPYPPSKAWNAGYFLSMYLHATLTDVLRDDSQRWFSEMHHNVATLWQHYFELWSIWKNSFLNCGCRWEWRMIIAVNFPI